MKITYSPAYTIVPTYECFNNCTYCNFRIDPGKDNWLTLENAKKIFQNLQNHHICEILILSGEVHPQIPLREKWFQHIYQLCELALSFNFLPHTNAGILSFREMQKLKSVNVSMGLMLEQLTPKLMQTVHKQSPSKIPEVRLQQLKWAGELKIPFTTGLLLGIGETAKDRIDTLEAIATLHHQYGHIQEVILQPHSLGSRETFTGAQFSPHQLPELIYQARQILPTEITIQIPPNLIPEKQYILACLQAGARDLGGIVPKDEVNPDYTHSDKQQLEKILRSGGWELQSRLPIYPQFDSWLNVKLQSKVKLWRQKLDKSAIY